MASVFTQMDSDAIGASMFSNGSSMHRIRITGATGLAQSSNMVDIHATILIERDSQKGIIIGKRGALLKEIGSEARTDIEMLLGTKVYLNLWVKVQKDWRNKAGQLRELGFRDDEY